MCTSPQNPCALQARNVKSGKSTIYCTYMYIHICLQWGFRIAIAGPRDNMVEYESVSASIFDALNGPDQPT